eukprot:GHVS01091902.1.p1 GENE.GHVS01091902.1~~GHVS01091902.1.p1  ORF type:complete len:844 (-),score=175.40 GHVS01091902.1:280-2811(-)
MTATNYYDDRLSSSTNSQQEWSMSVLIHNRYLYLLRQHNNTTQQRQQQQRLFIPYHYSPSTAAPPPTTTATTTESLLCSLPIFGCLGIVQLEARFLVVVTSRECCLLPTAPIYHIAALCFICLDPPPLLSASQEDNWIQGLNAQGLSTDESSPQPSPANRPFSGWFKEEEYSPLLFPHSTTKENYFLSSPPSSSSSTVCAVHLLVPGHPPVLLSSTTTPTSSYCGLRHSLLKQLGLYVQVFGRGGFYFSWDFDVTTCLQAQMMKRPLAHKQRPTAATANHRSHQQRICGGGEEGESGGGRSFCWEDSFCWNKLFMEDMKKMKGQPWLVNIISGFVESRPCFVGGELVEVALISRRSSQRAGVRFLSRGLDVDGNAANFVETEQILVYRQGRRLQICSHVQLRGSIPFIWTQLPSLRWSPRPHLSPLLETRCVEACRRHMDSCLSAHGGGPMLLINLVDKKGSQKKLGDRFREVVMSLKMSALKYIWFDFHHECRAMRWDRLSVLLNEVKSDLTAQGFFHAQLPTYEVCSNQRGVCRSNCIDCLDRTNVVQSVLARTVLHRQLQTLKLLPTLDDKDLAPFAVLGSVELEEAFRCIWSNHADRLSCLYSGTPALKTDFTRTGRRTVVGALMDGKHSVQRYFLNNFSDGFLQDSLDLVTGRSSTSAASSSCCPWAMRERLTTVALEWLCLATLSLLLLSSVLPLMTLVNTAEGIGRGCQVVFTWLFWILTLMQMARPKFSFATPPASSSPASHTACQPTQQQVDCMILGGGGGGGGVFGDNKCYDEDRCPLTIDFCFNGEGGGEFVYPPFVLHGWLFLALLTLLSFCGYVYMRGAYVATRPSLCPP